MDVQGRSLTTLRYFLFVKRTSQDDTSYLMLYHLVVAVMYLLGY